MSIVLTDAYLPAKLNCEPMTDEEFMDFCNEHPDLFFEMTAEGELIVMAPTFSATSARNIDLSSQLQYWARRDGRGFAFESSGGYVLPNGARRSPDASWVLETRIDKLSSEGEIGFLHLCPDFVVELRSKTDRLKPLQEKMREYMANGAQLGWLIDPSKRSVTIYRPESEPETRANISTIQGEGLLATFTLELTSIWNPFRR